MNDELPDECMKTAEFNTMVDDGVIFLRSVVEFYGQERGMQVWDHFNEVLGTDVKDAVLMKLLMGEGGYARVSMRVRPGVATIHRVPAVKAVRLLSGLGLKEALDLVKQAEANEPVVFDVVNRQNYHQGVKELREAGMSVR